MLRKNGKLVSCEPCRAPKSGVIIEDPLKPPLPWSEPLAPSPTDDNSPTLRNCTTARVSSQIATAPISQATYLGLTSFLASFHDNPCDLNLLTARSPNASVLRKTWSPDYTHRLTQLLQPLKLFEDFIRNCYQHSWPEEDLVAKITQNTTSRAAQVESNMTAEGFSGLFAGTNLRWEFVGIIFALAGLSAHTPLDPDLFAMEMAEASHACIGICKKYDNVNDLVIWLHYEYVVLASTTLGERSHNIYAHFGELVSSIHAMGLQRQQSSRSPVPFFLSEARKRVFAASYRTDKNLATFLGRSPRLPCYYCNVDLPLDIDHESLTLSQGTLAGVDRELGSDGWNIVGTTSSIKLRPATVMGLCPRRRSETIREELQTTYQECKSLWYKDPSHPHLSIISLIIHLEFLHTVFQVERIRCREIPETITDLLDSAMQIISAVTDYLKLLEQEVNIRKQYIWIVLSFSCTAGSGCRCDELHRCTLSKVPLSCSTSRSKVTRDLSLLVSWFEGASLPTSDTHQACVEVT
ncbi:hypothetical protein BDV29DRAFT_199578 [Aspergillus leporis]|uniref:Xylanolytic transcriptional activator regulatory domain-containing protein n=1 Tax=Aspergillus leporis TaxID=41062 RepID=A0A5N5WKK9_9EURO|nr:hypothetical protein BDV29DRAFT_199578 [Aspergillus leporis]